MSRALNSVFVHNVMTSQ